MTDSMRPPTAAPQPSMTPPMHISTPHEAHGFDTYVRLQPVGSPPVAVGLRRLYRLPQWNGVRLVFLVHVLAVIRSRFALRLRKGAGANFTTEELGAVRPANRDATHTHLARFQGERGVYADTQSITVQLEITGKLAPEWNISNG